MADQDILRTTEIMKAALPFIDFGNKAKTELLVKAFELMGTLQSVKSSNNLSAQSFTVGKIDFEGLLNGIRPVCNNKERAIIDKILGFFNMKKMFEMYNNIMETMKTMNEFGGFNFGGDSNGDDTDNVTGNFSGANFESIFNTFKNFTQASSATDAFNDSEFSNTSSEEQPSEANDNQDSKVESEKEEAPRTGNNGFRGNDMMFEMLKSMVPPEQMTTFENLSMLLNTMSYDSNSNQDNKEQNNG